MDFHVGREMRYGIDGLGRLQSMKETIISWSTLRRSTTPARDSFRTARYTYLWRFTLPRAKNIEHGDSEQEGPGAGVVRSEWWEAGSHSHVSPHRHEPPRLQQGFFFCILTHDAPSKNNTANYISLYRGTDLTRYSI
jgi:hypothetical protein